MNELKTDDVMRALECHIKRRCYECPLGKEEIENLSKPCSTMIAKLALALLREKDAEIADYIRQIAEMQAQIATQESELTALMKRKKIEADKDAEIERLRYNLNSVLSERADHTEAVSEAVVEFGKMINSVLDGKDWLKSWVRLCVSEFLERRNK